MNRESCRRLFAFGFVTIHGRSSIVLILDIQNPFSRQRKLLSAAKTIFVLKNFVVSKKGNVFIAWQCYCSIFHPVSILNDWTLLLTCLWRSNVLWVWDKIQSMINYTCISTIHLTNICRWGYWTFRIRIMLFVGLFTTLTHFCYTVIPYLSTAVN